MERKLRKTRRGVKQLGVDEKAVAKGHKYLTLSLVIDDYFVICHDQ